MYPAHRRVLFQAVIVLTSQIAVKPECGRPIPANACVSGRIALAKIVCHARAQHAPMITIKMSSKIALMIARGLSMAMRV